MFTNDFKACIMAGVPAVAIATAEWERLEADLAGVAEQNDYHYMYWSHTKGLVDTSQNKVLAYNPADMLEPFEMVVKMEGLNGTEEGMQDTIIAFFNFGLTNPTVQQKIRDVLPYCKQNGVTLVFISVSGKIPPELEKEIIVLEYDLPDARAIKEIINGILGTEANPDESYINQMIEAATGLTQSEADNMIAVALAQNNITLNDAAVAQVKKEKAQALKQSGVLELYEPIDLPKVGGLDNLKMWLWERGKAFSPEAREFGLPFPKGILVFGVPGTGKSLIAKTISKEWNYPLLLMGNVLDKYVGESEKRMKEALKIAERMAPCILMIDECEKFFSGVGGGSDSGVSSRVFGQFLSWMQESTAPVFVVATANSIQGLPPELLRKGRFDEIWFVDLPGRKEREEIFNIHINRKGRDVNNFDTQRLAKETSGYTGSELEQVVIAGLYRAFSQGKDIDTETLVEAAKETAPLSVTMADQIGAMREWGKARARLASSEEVSAPEKQLNAFNVSRKIRVK